MSTRLMSLGDSVSCGEGVGVHVALPGTWVGLLAGALPGGVLDPLARAGSRIRDVRAEQLPVAVARPAPVTTLLIGLNDVIRAGFDPASFAADLVAVVDGLRATGTTLVLARLHDPTGLLPLPGGLRRHVTGRVDTINAAIDRAAARPGPGPVLLLDLAALPALRSRGAWSVDRLHPGPAGHRAMAHAAGGLLVAAGVRVDAAALAPGELSRGPGRLAEGRWLVRHGMPWMGRHVRLVAMPVAGMALGRGR